MDTTSLHLYGYDRQTNQYRRLANTAYRFDANGYLHIATEYAGDIIVSDGPLVKRGGSAAGGTAADGTTAKSKQLYVAWPEITQLLRPSATIAPMGMAVTPVAFAAQPPAAPEEKEPENGLRIRLALAAVISSVMAAAVLRAVKIT
jgi:hypothetical protein